jgi:hypothetical protein
MTFPSPLVTTDRENFPTVGGSEQGKNHKQLSGNVHLL